MSASDNPRIDIWNEQVATREPIEDFEITPHSAGKEHQSALGLTKNRDHGETQAMPMLQSQFSQTRSSPLYSKFAHSFRRLSNFCRIRVKQSMLVGGLENSLSLPLYSPH
ncbi:hypothetical protein WG66_013869 [Moniliophthora roreri]|nr:hypothetical protein WG66_013869 [Moniliophthora roreri]